jgi:hypothetical protein
VRYTKVLFFTYNLALSGHQVAQMVQMLEAEQLESVVEKLKQEFNIRMLAVDNELNFVFEV